MLSFWRIKRRLDDRRHRFEDVYDTLTIIRLLRSAVNTVPLPIIRLSHY